MGAKQIKTVESMVAEANKEVRILGIEEAKAMVGNDDVTFVDVRDVREIAKTGRIPGARHVPRGMLEFWIDPASPYFKDFFGEDKTFVFYCAASWRSALSAKTAQDMGLTPVAHLEGGLGAWIKAGGEVEKKDG
ncbi:rhodanese-like domain-containing protein [Nisaea acidiphila]|uniref:Rhodanese-like domain-containing protein n=1 Tax=Nisaea acidiphila TaxID=1862145 RepID=A0A9J7AT05_9PROT|nr:rhodanese-like domain-containing protein [Nisaea acidiphila]UUX49994.1 rhodanese-like domain-containing protein [Nisaea acidiphila]